MLKIYDNDEIRKFLKEFAKNNTTDLGVTSFYTTKDNVVVELSTPRYDETKDKMMKLLNVVTEFFEYKLKYSTKITEKIINTMGNEIVNLIINIDLKTKIEEE